MVLRAAVPAPDKPGQAQAFNSSLFHPGPPGPTGQDAGMRAFITGGVRPPSDASSDVATLENGCTPGSIESTSSAGHGDGGGQGMGFRDQGSAPLMGATTGGAPGTRSQELGAGLYYQPAAAGQPYLSVAQGMPGMPHALQGLPHGMQGMPHYGSLGLPSGLIGAGGPPIGGAVGGGSIGSGPLGGGGAVGGAAGYMQFPVGSGGGGGGGIGATAPIGRASIDWFAGAHGAPHHPPPPGGARIGRSSFDEDRFRQPGAVGGAAIGSGLHAPLIGSGAGPLIGGVPAPLAGAPIGHAGAQALVPGGPLLPGMAMGADPARSGRGPDICCQRRARRSPIRPPRPAPARRLRLTLAPRCTTGRAAAAAAWTLACCGAAARWRRGPQS